MDAAPTIGFRCLIGEDMDVVMFCTGFRDRQGAALQDSKVIWLEASNDASLSTKIAPQWLHLDHSGLQNRLRKGWDPVTDLE